MTRDECMRRYVGICENGAEGAEVLARAALPPIGDPALMYEGKYAGMADYFAASARQYRDEADRARGLLR